MKTHELFPSLRGEKPGRSLRDTLDDWKDLIRLQELIMKAVCSGKFQKWTPEKVFRKHVGANKPPADERHYSPKELADAWGLSPDTIRELFENEPDVMVIGDKRGTRRKRRYRTMKIPQSVAVRVHRRLSAKPC